MNLLKHTIFREGEGNPTGSGHPNPTVVPNTNVPPAGVPPAPAPAPANAAPPAPAPAPKQNRKVVTMTTEQLNERNQRAATAEAKRINEANDARARELGFGSHAEMIADLAMKRNAPAPTAPAPRQNTNKGLSEIEKQKWQREREANAAKVAKAERRERIARQRVDALEVENQLLRIIHSVGIKDTDVALHLYQRKIESMTDEERAKLDETEFFKGLKASRPYLWEAEKVVEVPANTGNPNSPAPPAPPNVSGAPKFDARTEKDPAKLREHMAKMGVQYPS